MGIFSEFLALLQIVDRARERFKSKNSAETATPASRFVEVFESHGIHRNQIPRYFPDRLTLSDVSTDKALTSVLDQSLIDKVSDLFKVNPDWVECAGTHPYQPLDFYKQPQKFVEFIDTLLRSGSGLSGVVFTSDAPVSGDSADAFILLEETFEFLPGVSLNRYYILGNWFFYYGKSRAYLVACIAAAWRKKVYISGRKVSQEFVSRYEAGEQLLEPDISDCWPGSRWHPEDMVLNAGQLVEGLPTEHDKQVASAIIRELGLKDRRFSLSEKEILENLKSGE